MCDNCCKGVKVVDRDMTIEAVKLVNMIKEMEENGCNITMK